MKLLLLTITLCSLALMTSCKKEGCDDEAAVNYSAEANKNNGSCGYEGKAVFWYKYAASDSLVNNGVTNLLFFLDSAYIGSYSPASYWVIPPNCGQAISTSLNMGGDMTRTYPYYVHDQNGNDVWTGSITYVGGECTSEELVY